jgi:adenine-specific DNA methylase
MTEDRPRLIERAFPLKQASLDSVHEKNVRHGHISTLHIWPARRPLAACRAALIATLLPDPGTPEKRRELIERIGGRVVKKPIRKRVGERVIETLKEETVGGVLHWGRENSPDMDYFREEIRKAYGGRAPRVLDPFAGGGSIPLEAMRLGCEVTAADINPVAWFILKCTLEYPQRLAGQKLPLPSFILKNEQFMEAFFKANPSYLGSARPTKGQLQLALGAVAAGEAPPPMADLAWHVRAWGHWVLERAKAELVPYYPVVDGKPTVAYLWARTVQCKNCRATIPLLKTLWLCKKPNKRVKLELKPRADKSGVDFEIVEPPVVGGNAAQRREHDQRIGRGTMLRSGAWCPCCGKPDTVSLTREDIQQEGVNSHLGEVMTTVIVDGPDYREYRLPTCEEISAAEAARQALPRVYADVPHGVPTEPLINDTKGNCWCVLYGIDSFDKLFTPRQLVVLGTLVTTTRLARTELKAAGYPDDWCDAITSYLAVCISRTADRNSRISWWQTSAQKIGPTFTHWALAMSWDFAEICPWADASGGYLQAVEWVAEVTAHLTGVGLSAAEPSIILTSATQRSPGDYDAVVTDPPYYDAIGYAVLMDFYYVWLRRAVGDLTPTAASAYATPLSPKWDEAKQDGELVDDASRHGGDRAVSKAVYEDGMARAFAACRDSLGPAGRLVVVFANKQPDAWEALVSAIIRSGFVVDGSWPIQTERVGRVRSVASAALSSSVWLVCRKRPESARPGWDNRVLEEMRSKIHDRLREYWDAGIRGPDFVWAATGPALEPYSAHPIVKKANSPNEAMTVSEFLREVRRIVVDFVVGRVLSRNGDGEIVSELDDTTIYYLLHRYDFGFADAPAGAVILYAGSCGLSDGELCDREILIKSGGQPAEEDEEPDSESDEEPEEGTGSTMRLRPWHHRKRESLGLSMEGRPAPLIDQTHRLMRLWKAGDVHRVDAYIEENGLRRNELFHRLLQSLIELARRENQADECTILESISNHVAARGVAPAAKPVLFDLPPDQGDSEDE